MKLFAGVIALLFAVAISAVAGYFSIVGLAALFSATFMAVVVMGVVLEGGKLVAAAWLHANWRNPGVGLLHKTYLTLAVGALMVITAVGIYGFLAKGYLEQEAPIASIQIQVERREAQIVQLRGDLERLANRQRQLDAAVDALTGNNRVTQATTLRNQQRVERETILREVEQKNRDISRLSDELVPLRTQASEVQAKLGPIRYVAELFGWQDLDAAVRLVILILMFAFDPLAVVLVLSGTISIGQWAEERRIRRGGVATTVERNDVPALVYWEVEKREAEFQRALIEHAEVRHKSSLWEKTAKESLRHAARLADEISALRETQPKPVPAYDVGMTFAVDLPKMPTTAPMVFMVPDLPPPSPSKEELLAMLEERPEIVQELIDAARSAEPPATTDEPQAPQTNRWLGPA